MLIARKGTAVHFDVAAINRIDYEDFTELVDAWRSEFEQLPIGLALSSRQKQSIPNSVF